MSRWLLTLLQDANGLFVHSQTTERAPNLPPGGREELARITSQDTTMSAACEGSWAEPQSLTGAAPCLGARPWPPAHRCLLPPLCAPLSSQSPSRRINTRSRSQTVSWCASRATSIEVPLARFRLIVSLFLCVCISFPQQFSSVCLSETIIPEARTALHQRPTKGRRKGAGVSTASPSLLTCTHSCACVCEAVHV